jgi:predicted nucleotide-binding protein (sugar kinase/HSP70/actin superfamily)
MQYFSDNLIDSVDNEKQYSVFEQYRRPKENPFLKKDLDSTTLLFGGLTIKHEILLKASFENLGYTCDIVPNPDFEALQYGKEFCDPGLCNPVYFTFGSLLKYLKEVESKGLSKTEIISKYVFFTAGSCGPCRFGMYEAQFRLGLKNSGFEGFRVIIFQQNEGLDQSKEESALQFNHDFFLRVLSSFVIADLINDLFYQYRPFEIEKGSVNKILEETLYESYNLIKKIQYPYIITLINKGIEKRILPRSLALINKIIFFTFCNEYKTIVKSFYEKIRKVKFDFLQVKPVVKITGEFWAQTTEGDGNLNMHKFLEENGAQVIPEQLSNWIMYLLHQMKINKQLEISRKRVKPGSLFGKMKSIAVDFYDFFLFQLAELLFSSYYNRFRKFLGNIPYPLVSQNKMRKMAGHYFNPLIEGGEGHLEIGKTIYYTKMKQCHMVISVKPFGCMPSAMSDGIMSAVGSHNHEILFSSIETGGEGIVNMYSRVLMTLSEAKELARNEYSDAILNFEKKEGASVKKDYSFFPFRKKNGIHGKISTAAKFVLFNRNN